ncbi:hypothetical protein [Teredinibacter turnerae]|uniref:hypothetical protein n=1 Tax=Teredinibacter turnerae TaxID=2426 RepID=UPI00037614F6|nr:hypothetical protein [Teredinibacter turnerae]
MGKAVGTLAPGEERAFPVGGNYLQVIKTAQVLEIELVQNSYAYESHLLKQGAALHEKNFSSVVVRNEGNATTEIYISTGVGKFQPSQNDAVVTVDTSQGSVPVTMDEGQLNLSINQQITGSTNTALPRVTVEPGASAKICDADVSGNRKYVKYNILSSADCEYVTIGGSSVDATSGYALERGMLAVDETTGELWAHNPGAVAVDIWSVEVV